MFDYILSIKTLLFTVVAVAVASAIAVMVIDFSMMIGNAQALMYNSNHINNYYNAYLDPKECPFVNTQKMECLNSNIKANGINITQITRGSTAVLAEAIRASKPLDATNIQTGNRLEDRTYLDKSIENMCFNNTLKQQIKVNPYEDCFTENSLTLMTWNIYQGADQSPIFNATTPSEFVTAVGSAYNRLQATNFGERVYSIADEIQDTQPDLIGLQEAILLRTQIPSDGSETLATNIKLDYLQILINTLAERGLIYEPIVVQTSTDIEVPGLTSTGLVDIRLTDRDVILAEANNNFTLSNIQGAQFAAKLPLTTPFGSISILRSWVSVDVTFDKGDKVRVVSTHLEALSPFIQELQADELLNGLGNTDLPVVFIGDFNSNANGNGTQTYTKLKDAGFIDAWTIKGTGTGFTCCQAEDLVNPESSLTNRIDLLIFRGDFKVKDIDIVGNSQKDHTISGLWPSDHAGVVATLKLNSDK
ncbi:MAG TPA: endonuclease/exonuclease/phosphatase family protein [Nitrososphaeraceae archaeon]|nr:endonuclease/exonuclease/phosphatase family protein [Nitrososphaeraceae archaeon]